MAPVLFTGALAPGIWKDSCMAGSRSRRWSTPSRYPRTARINKVLREVIAGDLERIGQDDPRLDLVTITDVDIDADLGHATVFFSALGTKASRDEVLAALEEARKELQASVGRSVRMKRTPLLTFVPDPAIEAGQNVENILRNLHQQESQGVSSGTADAESDHQ